MDDIGDENKTIVNFALPSCLKVHSTELVCLQCMFECYVMLSMMNINILKNRIKGKNAVSSCHDDEK